MKSETRKNIIGWAVIIIFCGLALTGGYSWFHREIPALTSRNHGGDMPNCYLLEVEGQKYWSCVSVSEAIITVPCTRCDKPPKWLSPETQR